EARGITHRDIKPANLGLTGAQSKKAEELLLFDFSLSALPEDTIRLGTPAYRDPWLGVGKRKTWDAAADRYSAAVTLHEMLTGERPSYGEANPAVVKDARVLLEETRFDSTVRDGLLAFFAECFD